MEEIKAGTRENMKIMEVKRAEGLFLTRQKRQISGALIGFTLTSILPPLTQYTVRRVGVSATSG